MKTKLAKSPEMLYKEKTVRKLTAKLKKKQTTLRNLKTRLKNTQKEIEEKQKQFYAVGIVQMEDVDNLRKEVVELAEKFLKIKGVPQDDKEQVRVIVQEFGGENFFGEEYAAHRQMMKEQELDFDYEEASRGKIDGIFKEFQVNPDAKEQRDIRKMFLNLSKKYHPDKAENEKDAEAYHEIMQQLNNAYENNDIQAILDIDRQYSDFESDVEVTVVTLDYLQARIDSLTRELELIQNQIARTNTELKSLRKSPLGQMLKDFNRADKEGAGLEQMATQIDLTIKMFGQLKACLEDSIKLKRLSPTFEDFADEYLSSPDDVLEMLANFIDEFDEDMFDDEEYWEDEEDYYHKEPDFQRDSTVRIISNIKLQGTNVSIKGWVGRVDEVLEITEDDKILYSVSFDKESLAKMPKKYLQDSREGNEMHYFPYTEVWEHQLEACEPRSTMDEDNYAQRKIFHAYQWNYLGKEKAEKMQKIMFRLSKGSDESNWKTYILENMYFPFEATLCIDLYSNRKKQRVTVLGLEKNPNPVTLFTFGLAINVRIGRKTECVSLSEIEVPKDHKYYELLTLYREWERTETLITLT